MARALLVFSLLAVLHTWPLAAAPHRRSLNHNADAQLNAWIVSWIAHVLPRAPATLWHGNIFQPGERALTFSEPLIVPAIAGAPVRALGGSAVLVFNLLLIAGLVATALAGWYIVMRWTGSMAGGLVAGALVAFNPHLLTRLPHLQAAHAWTLLLSLYLADQLLGACAKEAGPVLHKDHQMRRAKEAGSLFHRYHVGRALPLAIALVLTAATSLHWLLFSALGILLLLATRRPDAGALVRLAVAIGIAAVASLPVTWPYLHAASQGAARPLDQVAQFSATPAGYVVSLSHVHAGWTSRWFTTDVNVFFPGVAAWLAAVAGAGFFLRRGGTGRSRALGLVALALAGFLLSLGTATPVYGWLYEWMLPLRGIRAAARFGYLTIAAVALLAGMGVAIVDARLRSRAARLVLIAGALVAVTAENVVSPIRTTPFHGVPALYALVRDAPEPVLLVEAPFYPADAVFENGEYVLNATSHWRPLMNGYSGLTPSSYRRRALSFWFFPDATAIDDMKREGATHLMVHLERFGTDAPGVIAALERRADLTLIGADRDGHRLYRF